MRGSRIRQSALALACLATAVPAYAYVGPGAGVSALGIVVGLIAAVILGIVGFVWYPIKRLLKLRRERAASVPPDPSAGEPPAKER